MRAMNAAGKGDHIAGVVLVVSASIVGCILGIDPSRGSIEQSAGVPALGLLHNALRVVLAPALVEGLVLYDAGEAQVILRQASAVVRSAKTWLTMVAA